MAGTQVFPYDLNDYVKFYYIPLSFKNIEGGDETFAFYSFLT